MRRHTLVPVLALAAVAAVALVAATLAAGGTSGSRSAQASPFTSHPAVNGRLSVVKLLDRPPRIANTIKDEPGEVELEPRLKLLAPGITPAAGKVVGDLADTLKLGRAGKSTLLQGKPLPTFKGLGKGTVVRRAAVPRTTQQAGARSSGTDFSFFRIQSIPVGSTSSGKNEPAVGNDRDVIFFTGNKYAAVSVDDGISFRYIDPKLLDDANGDGSVSASEKTDGGFCCDQLVNASDEGGNELVVWLTQYYANDDESTIRLVTYRGKSDLATPDDENRRCIYDFHASSFGYSGKRWMDFSTMQNSNDWLYGTINVYTLPDDSTSEFLGSAVWRIKLADMADDDCTLEHGYESLQTEDYGDSLVQGAGSTMWWATHKDNANTHLRIYKATDGSTDVTITDKNIKNFHVSSDEPSCKTPDKNNPCGNLNSRILTGWTGNGKVGWMWNVAQGGGYSYPHVQGAIFKTSDLSLTDEPIIYNDSYAWVFPAVGVNGRGDVGGTIYRIGGGEYPRARAFIVDDVDTSWSSLQMHGIATSTTTVPDDVYGDYGTTVRFDGCSNTWAAGVFTHTSSDYFSSGQPWFVWFGRERDGCADLVVEKLAHLYDSANAKLWIGDTTRNIGSGEAAAASTRFYLSRDADQDSGDTRLSASHATPSLDASDSDALLTEAALPSDLAAGTWYLIACADDLEVVSEVTNTNNCTVDGSTISVKRDIGTITSGVLTRPGITRPALTTGPAVTRPGPVITRPTITRPTITRPAVTTRPTITRPAVTTRPTITRPTITRQGPAGGGRTVPDRPGSTTLQTQG